MNLRVILLLGAALATPELAPAEMPVSGASLGQIEGILNFCSRIVPQSAEDVSKTAQAIVAKATPEELADARASQEYKDAYDQVTAQLSGVPKSEAPQACKTLLPGH